ncbi:uncharacterized protein LOC101027033 isoform X2 [Papio anubis]|uniref:uncharacterized protein LOC101027033 isoform X2 n=1 Tax=Papio anubis TaxID=9555 RepID=UPI0012AD455B|nr:uncharacterized protein LOC101027033 isoform X2 [Papio anubis]
MSFSPQISTQSRNHLPTHSPRIPTAVEISTQGQSHILNPSLAILATAEVTSMMWTVMTDATRPGPGRLQEVAAVATPVMTTPATHMEDGAIDPTLVMEILMVEITIRRMAIQKAIW